MDQHPQSSTPHSHDDTDHHHDHPHEAHDTHSHSHDEAQDHSHAHEDPHGHSHGTGLWGWMNTIFHLHGHREQQLQRASDPALNDNTAGIRTVWLALGALSATTVLQIIIVYSSGSVALLADTVHNLGDSLNSIPLLIAFYLARRAATRRYTYGFARAEDVAGIFIVISIAFSAAVIFWQSIQKLIYPAPMQNLGWVALAAIIGFFGNEFVAWLQIRKGREIGSAALVADGQHARTDGLTSLAVLLAAGAAWLGYPIVDPLIGLLIGVTILFITKDAIITMWYRLMDAIEPEYLKKAEMVIEQQAEVKELRRVRMRWMGHRIQAEVYIAVAPHLDIAQGHQVAEQLRHDLFHALPHLAEVVVHVDPWSQARSEHHELTTHHELVPEPLVR